MVKVYLSCVLTILSWSAGIVNADEPDVKFMNKEIKKLKDIKKIAWPVYAKTAGNGVIKLEGNRAKWNDDTLVNIGSLGWTSNSTLQMRDGFVFVNVGPSPIKVDDFEIKKGEYAQYKGKKLRKATIQDLKK